MLQKLILNIDAVLLITRDYGPDSLSITVPAADIINKVTRDKLQAHQGLQGVDIWGDCLKFDVQITAGCGKKLADALGLKIEEVPY